MNKFCSCFLEKSFQSERKHLVCRTSHKWFDWMDFQCTTFPNKRPCLQTKNVQSALNRNLYSALLPAINLPFFYGAYRKNVGRCNPYKLCAAVLLLNFKITNWFQSLKWRKEKRADDAVNFKIHPFFKQNYAFKFGCTDMLGQPGELAELHWNILVTC